jgi:HEAT repeat protein
MSATAFFVRTLLKATAIFLGTTLVFVNPTFEWTASRGAVTAHKSPAKAAVDGLIAALRDQNAGVRREAALALGRIADASALPSLSRALGDENPIVRGAAAQAIAEITAGRRAATPREQVR